MASLSRATVFGWPALFVLSAVVAGGAPGCAETCEPAPEAGLGEPTAWERAFLDGPGVPTPPAYELLPAEDGLALAYVDWVPEAWDGSGPVVLFVHGSSAHGALYGVLGEAMAAEGVLARLVDLRGHGRSVCLTPDDCGDVAGPRSFVDDGRYWVGRPGDSADPDQIVRDLRRHLADLRSRWPDAPVFVAGHSSGGGTISRLVATGGMSDLDGAMLVAPFNHAEQPQNQLDSWACGRIVGTDYAHVHMPALGDARRGAIHRYTLSFHKPEVYRDDLDTAWNSYTTALGMAAPDPDGFHQTFDGPVLWVAGEMDALFDVEAARGEHARMPGAAAFVVVRDTSHVGLSWSAGVGRLLAAFAHDPGGVEDGIIEPQ